MRKAFTFTLLIILVAGMSGYYQSWLSVENTTEAWRYSDVRIIDPIDSKSTGTEIVAVLSKHDNEMLKIRVDFLDLFLEQSDDLLVYIDNKPGGNTTANQNSFRWDYLIQYTNTGLLRFVTDEYVEIDSMKLRIYKDLIGKYIELTLGLGNHLVNLNSAQLMIGIQSPESSLLIDQTKPFILDGSSPPPIDISFVFWNVMDSSTSATILRSWAGAHTGPQSSRHGLTYLLSAVETWNIPVNICGIYDRDVNFALNYLQVWPMINGMIQDSLLNPIDRCSKDGYLEQQVNLMMSNQLLSDSSILASEIITNHFIKRDSQVILGGDFSKSFLGSPDTLTLIFSYITSHPWIRVTSSFGNSHLISTVCDTQSIIEGEESYIPYTTTGIPIPSGVTVFEIQTLISSEIVKLPQNRISTLARQVYKSIIESDLENIRIARGSYLSQLGHFFQAAYWTENPREIHTCQQDIDWDGQYECILASTNTFMTFELDGGYLAYLFTINSNGAHQLVGPTTQFDILRSDPSELISEMGIAGDPGQIIGAFADPISFLQEYQINSINPYQIELISHDRNIRKLFSLHDRIIHVVISDIGQEVVSVHQLPLLLDPWRIYEHFTPDIFYWGLSEQKQWIWGLGDDVSIGIKSNSEYEQYAFNTTYAALKFPEDPNYSYTRGHVLPIPMALVEFQPQGTIIIDLTIDP
jgi:hypothetical protein